MAIKTKKPTQNALRAARQRIIEELVEDRVATIMNAEDDGAKLKTFFREGHDGYGNFDDGELLAEIEALEDNPDANEATAVRTAIATLKQASCMR